MSNVIYCEDIQNCRKFYIDDITSYLYYFASLAGEGIKRKVSKAIENLSLIKNSRLTLVLSRMGKNDCNIKLKKYASKYNPCLFEICKI